MRQVRKARFHRDLLRGSLYTFILDLSILFRCSLIWHLSFDRSGHASDILVTHLLALAFSTSRLLSRMV